MGCMAQEKDEQSRGHTARGGGALTHFQLRQVGRQGLSPLRDLLELGIGGFQSFLQDAV